MVSITLSSGQTVPANRHDMKDILQSLDLRYRYCLTSRQLGENMIINRIRRAAALKRARLRALMRYKH